MSTNVWGPPTWILFHTLIAKLTDDGFNIIGLQLFNYIKRICNNLPCPDCAQHATQFLSRVNMATIKTKDDLRNTMYIFHNMVNKRKNKPMYHVNDLEKYKSNNSVEKYNNFIMHFKTKGNMKLLADSFQRKLLVNDFKKWLMTNIRFFI
jgi:hypothetical protein